MRWNHWPRAHLPAGAPGLRPSKYKAVPTYLDGVRFASLHEARRYQHLCLLARSGLVLDLTLQPRYPILVVPLASARDGALTFEYCGHFTADFKYVDAETGEVVIEDAKSAPTKTTAYRLRKRLVEAIHGITIREV